MTQDFLVWFTHTCLDSIKMKGVTWTEACDVLPASIQINKKNIRASSQLLNCLLIFMNL